MVRLVITDFPSKEESKSFYMEDEFEESQDLFVYSKFKKYSVSLSKYNIDELYSLNLLSKKYLLKNQFLVYVSDEEYIILFNHKTVYSAKINENFLTDDIVKSILITKHIAMLSSGGSIENIYYVINSKYKSAKEHILKENTKNDKNEVIAKPLGNMNDLIKPLNPLVTPKMQINSIASFVFSIGISFWAIFYGIELFTEKFLKQEPISILKRELAVEKRLIAKEKRLLRANQINYRKITECITDIKVSR